MINLIPLYQNEKILRDIARWRNDPEIKPGLRSWYDTNYSHQKQWAEKIISDHTCHYYFILNNNDCIGYCGFDKLDFANRTAEISMLIAPNMHGHNCGKRAVNLLLEKGFNEFNLNLIYAEVNGNTTNMVFWEKCRFVFEWNLRERKYWQGKYYHAQILSITKAEFFEKN